MPRSRRHRILVEYQISRNQLRAFIHDAVTKCNIVPNDEHYLIIETILNNIPRPLDHIYLSRWCRNFVQPYMTQIEHHVPQCREICEAVRKELLLMLYKPQLNKLTSLALNAKIPINPHWIELNKIAAHLGALLKNNFAHPKEK